MKPWPEYGTRAFVERALEEAEEHMAFLARATSWARRVEGTPEDCPKALEYRAMGLGWIGTQAGHIEQLKGELAHFADILQMSPKP